MADVSRIQSEIDQLKSDLTFELQRRERPDRHPYQLGCLSGLLGVSLSQAIIGINPTSALYEVAERLTILAINSTFIVGAIMCLMGAFLSRDSHFELSVRVGMYGHVSVFVGCLFYTAVVIASTKPEFGEKPYWLSVTSVLLSLGIAYASVMRFKQMGALLKEWRRRGGPDATDIALGGSG
jgi:hypothetical protein